MAIVSLAVGGILLLGMIGVTWHGAVTLPAGARIPIHYGLGSYNNFASKTVGLIVWPVGGALIYGILAAVTAGAVKPHHHFSASSHPATLVMLAMLAVVLVAQWGAISVARRGSGAAPGLKPAAPATGVR